VAIFNSETHIKYSAGFSDWISVYQFNRLNAVECSCKVVKRRNTFYCVESYIQRNWGSITIVCLKNVSYLRRRVALAIGLLFVVCSFSPSFCRHLLSALCSFTIAANLQMLAHHFRDYTVVVLHFEFV